MRVEALVREEFNNTVSKLPKKLPVSDSGAECSALSYSLTAFLIIGALLMVLIYMFSAFYHSLEEILVVVRFVQCTKRLMRDVAAAR